jgi:hypothetical protein
MQVQTFASQIASAKSCSLCFRNADARLREHYSLFRPSLAEETVAKPSKPTARLPAFQHQVLASTAESLRLDVGVVAQSNQRLSGRRRQNLFKGR